MSRRSFGPKEEKTVGEEVGIEARKKESTRTGGMGSGGKKKRKELKGNVISAKESPCQSRPERGDDLAEYTGWRLPTGRRKKGRNGTKVLDWAEI